jgi:hypothetical protein
VFLLLDSKLIFRTIYNKIKNIMKPLFTEEEYKKAKSEDYLPCECYQCKTIFYIHKKQITHKIKYQSNNEIKFCSKKCANLGKKKGIRVICKNCNITFEKLPCYIKKSPNNFCSKSCAATYNNKHNKKRIGNRRSKIEIYFEEQLIKLYPNLPFNFNKKDTIDSELDIYIPSMKLAFELNGIFHYEPIFGDSKLSQIQNNDNRKIQACIEKKISFCIVDISGLNYFKPEKANKFLKIITDIIDENLKQLEQIDLNNQSS